MLERSYFVPEKLGMKLLEMGKDMKIMHSVSSRLYKVWGTFFVKNFAWGSKVFWSNLWVMFYMGTNYQNMLKLMVKRFQRSSFQS